MATSTFERMFDRFDRDMRSVYEWVREDIELEEQEVGVGFTVMEDKVKVLRFGLDTCLRHGAVWGSVEMSLLCRERVYTFVLLLEEMVREMVRLGKLGRWEGKVRCLEVGFGEVRRELEDKIFGRGRDAVVSL